MLAASQRPAAAGQPVKLKDAAGNTLWSKRFGGTGSDGGHSVGVDSAGKVLVTGRFQGTIDFGGGALTSADIQAFDTFLAKFAP